MGHLSYGSIVIGLAALTLVQSRVPTVACADGWTFRPGPEVNVKTIGELERAVRTAKSGDTIVVAEGDYALAGTLDMRTANVTIRGRGGDPAKIVIHGRGMTGDSVGVALSISASDVTVADLTLRDVKFHAIQVRGELGASRFTLHNARLQDAGQQLLKGSVSNNGAFSADGLVACSEFSYTTNAPSDYTDGVDLLTTKRWVIRDNRFIRIRGPVSGGWSAGPAILAWVGAEETVVERNVIVDSFRGIALGLRTPTPPATYDHLGGVVRNNVIVNLNGWADEAIEANAARDVTIEHNTVFARSTRVGWSIGVRFPSASATVRNNLTNKQILLRNGGRAVLEGNVIGATEGWFVDAPNADMHLTPRAAGAFRAGVALPTPPVDFDRKPRAPGQPLDAGAFESSPGRGGGQR